MLIYGGTTNNFRLPPGDLSLSYIPTATQPTVYQVFKAAGFDLNSSKLDNLPIPTVDQFTNALAAATKATPNPFLQASFTGTANDYQNPRAFQAGLGLNHDGARWYAADIGRWFEEDWIGFAAATVTSTVTSATAPPTAPNRRQPVRSRGKSWLRGMGRASVARVPWFPGTYLR